MFMIEKKTEESKMHKMQTFKPLGTRTQFNIYDLIPSLLSHLKKVPKTFNEKVLLMEEIRARPCFFIFHIF